MVYEFYYKPRNETVEVSNTHIYARYANEVSDRLRRRFGPLLESLSRLLHAVPYLLGEKLGAITKQSSEHFHIVSCDSSAQRLCLLPAEYGRKATTGEDEPMRDGVDGGDGFVSDGRLLSPAETRWDPVSHLETCVPAVAGLLVGRGADYGYETLALRMRGPCGNMTKLTHRYGFLSDILTVMKCTVFL